MNKITNASRFLFEELVSRIQERSNAVGIAVAIVDRNGKTQYEKFFGYRDQEKKLPIDEDTIFGLASVTKSFVALSIMQLVEAGKVNLDDPVSKYIPEFTNRNQKTVKVWHFLCHTAGFYPMHRTIINEIAQKAGLDENETGDFAFCEKIALEGTKAVAELLDAQTKENGGLIGDPGNYMSYCNDGFGLLSEIVRRVGGENSFAEYVKKHILEPLHMERSSGEYVRPAADANAAVLYKMQKGVMTSGRDYHDNAFSLGGAGSLKSTLADMKKYICMYLNYGKGIDGTRILSQEGVRTMCRPRIDYRPDSHYCFGLAQKKMDDLTVMEHGGSLPGVSSNLSWSYDAGVGVMVLCNTSGVPVSTIADAAMRMYHGRNPIEDRFVYQETEWDAEKRTRIMRKVSRTFRLEFNRHTESMQCVLYDDQLVDKAFSPLFKVCEVLFVRMGETFLVRIAKKLSLCVLRVLFEHCGKFIGDCRLHFPLADEACQNGVVYGNICLCLL